MTERYLTEGERLKAISKKFEAAHQILHRPELYPPFIVKKAWKFVEEDGNAMLQDVADGDINADLAERIFCGLHHYENYVTTRRDMGENGPLSGVN